MRNGTLIKFDVTGGIVRDGLGYEYHVGSQLGELKQGMRVVFDAVAGKDGREIAYHVECATASFLNWVGVERMKREQAKAEEKRKAVEISEAVTKEFTISKAA